MLKRSEVNERFMSTTRVQGMLQNGIYIYPQQRPVGASGGGFLGDEIPPEMEQEKVSKPLSPAGCGLLIVIGILMLLCSPVCMGGSLWFDETKGPFKNWTQAVDWEGDGDLDVIVSHNRWEDVDIAWAGIFRWINQGNGKFELLSEGGTEYIGGDAAGAGDVDQDGDVDIFVQAPEMIRLLRNQGGLQEGKPGMFQWGGGIKIPFTLNQGYRDAGGTITTGDLNSDGSIDMFVAGCCYGMRPTKRGNNFLHAPSVSWVWINDGNLKNLQTEHIIPLDFLDGRPIRQVALGDLDGDGDLDVFAAVGKPTMGTIASMDDLILLNDGTGMFTVLDQQLGNTDSTSVALGDVNGDGRMDALVGTSAGARLWINQGNEVGSGGLIFVLAEQSFEPVQTVWGKLQAGYSAVADKLYGLYLPYGSIRTKAVFLTDLDGDGDLDVLIGRLWGAEIWWNDGQGEFTRSNVRFEYQEDTGVAVADFDGDGDQDIFTEGNGENYQVWRNDGNGVFIANNR
jgi:hypothetical protein